MTDQDPRIAEWARADAPEGGAMTPIQKARAQMRRGYLLAAVLWLSLLVTEWSHHDRLATDHMLRLLLAFGLVLACWLMAERDMREARP